MASPSPTASPDRTAATAADAIAIELARCVHTASPLATCAACEEACPRAAIAIGRDGPELASAACDGCGLCIAACPRAAIGPSFARAIAIGRDAIGPIAFAACERAGIAPGPGRIPCLHALGERDLAGLWRRGVRRLAVSSGDCATCPRGAATPLAHRLTRLDRLLSDRGLVPILLAALPAASWTERRDSAGAQPARGGPQRSRRGLFVFFEARADGSEDPPLPRAEDALLPGGADRDLALCAPRIHPARCEACDACARLCPDSAIALVREPEAAPTYLLDGHRCSGCGLCVDVCAVGAVELVAWARPARGRLALVAARCRSCGASFRMPAERPLGDGRCPICLRTGRIRRPREVDP
jgi:Pyruvate/2-oxoacid:ferredoxin oxidoreductase delta subunit